MFVYQTSYHLDSITVFRFLCVLCYKYCKKIAKEINCRMSC